MAATLRLGRVLALLALGLSCVLGQVFAEEAQTYEPAILVLPLHAAQDVPDEYSSAGFALQNVLENVVFADGQFADTWAFWYLDALFGTEEALLAWSRQEPGRLPPALKMTGRRFIAGGNFRLSPPASAKLWILDQETGRRLEEQVAVDLPGLQAFRSGFLRLLEGAGIEVAPRQRTAMMWEEDLPLEVLALFSEGLVAAAGQLLRGENGSDWEEMEQALPRAPTSYCVLSTLGSARVWEGNYEEARVFLKRALEVNPQGADAAEVLAQALAHLGDGEEGRRWASLSAEVRGYDPGVALATYLNNFAEVLADGQRYPQAVSTYREALTLWRSTGQRRAEGGTLYKLGQVHEELQRDGEARDCYERARALAVATGDALGEDLALTALGNLLLRLDDPEEARACFVRALELSRARGDRGGEAVSLRDVGRALAASGSLERARDYFEQALGVSIETGDRRFEGSIQYDLGELYEGLRQYGQARDCYERARALAVATGDGLGEDLALTALGDVLLRRLGDPEEARACFARALELSRARGDREGEGVSLGDLGRAHSAVGSLDHAMEYFRQSLIVSRELGDRPSEAFDLIDIGAVLNERGEYREAIEHAEQALETGRDLADKKIEGIALNALGMANHNLSNYENAILLYEQALEITRLIEDRDSESRILDNLGRVYGHLGQDSKAIAHHEEALRTAREINRGDYGTVLNNLGTARARARDDLSKVRRHFETLLSSEREADDRVSELVILNNLGWVCRRVGDYPKALEYLQQSLALARQLGHLRMEGTALNNLGSLSLDNNDPAEAVRHFGAALGLKRRNGERDGEAIALKGLMRSWCALDQPAVGVFFGKKAVNTLQHVRADLAGLPEEVQQSYLESNEYLFRDLADVLISEGRLPEAQRVLDLLKGEEYFEFVRRDGSVAAAVGGEVDLTPSESGWGRRYSVIGEGLTALGVERGALISKSARTTEEDARLAHLEGELEKAGRAFQEFLDSLAEEARQGRGSQEKVFQIREAQGLMEDLRELGSGAVALYTLATEQKLRIILVTPDVQKAAESSIGSAELGHKILAFREALQSPSSDPLPLARELYEAVVAPVADDLQAAKAKTLMWSLDGVLRYLPLSALHDGERYLVESYRNVVFTPASQARLKDEPKAQWRVLGLGVSRGHEGFEPLPGVVQELDGIVQEGGEDPGVLPGTVRLDDAFTLAEMRAGLRKRYPVVHIASHFRFRPGNETDSFLLLGDGTHLTLAQLKSLPNVFGGVDLLSLSACNTAMGGAGADGKEIEGFGVLAQRQGAKAVLASLWPVSDGSTQSLMNDFYRLRETGLSKVEALRQAQVALLRGGVAASAEPLSARAAILEDDSAEGVEEPGGSERATTYAHPYYWAPFILIGNWK